MPIFRKQVTAPQPSDPFGEIRTFKHRRRRTLLGAEIEFATDSNALAALADEAFAGLPAQRLAGAPALSIAMQLQPGAAEPKSKVPPLPVLQSAGGMLIGSFGGFGFAALAPTSRFALLSVNAAFLEHPYHLRYELMEFAVYTLAARARSLVPLHGGCIGKQGRGLLLLGDSGAGKSTLAMLSLYQGYDFLAEDAVFVEPRTLRATGISNFLHVRHEATRWLTPSQRRQVKAAPRIERRSGVRKYEVDLRQAPFRLARTPLEISALVFLSARFARGPMLNPLSRETALKRLKHEQAYAAALHAWRPFERKLRKLPVLELRRGEHPLESLAAIESLLA